MEINNKYDLDQEVWFMFKNKPEKSTPHTIYTRTTPLSEDGHHVIGEQVMITYGIYGYGDDNRDESELFPTKEALKNHVFGEGKE